MPQMEIMLDDLNLAVFGLTLSPELLQCMLTPLGAEYNIILI